MIGILRSFSYRRYLDFCHDRLRCADLQGADRTQVRRKGHECQYQTWQWPGIREIEFIVQVLQLIYGGKHLAPAAAWVCVAALVRACAAGMYRSERCRSPAVPVIFFCASLKTCNPGPCRDEADA